MNLCHLLNDWTAGTWPKSKIILNFFSFLEKTFFATAMPGSESVAAFPAQSRDYLLLFLNACTLAQIWLLMSVKHSPPHLRFSNTHTHTHTPLCNLTSCTLTLAAVAHITTTAPPQKTGTIGSSDLSQMSQKTSLNSHSMPLASEPLPASITSLRKVSSSFLHHLGNSSEKSNKNVNYHYGIVKELWPISSCSWVWKTVVAQL